MSVLIVNLKNKFQTTLNSINEDFVNCDGEDFSTNFRKETDENSIKVEFGHDIVKIILVHST